MTECAIPLEDEIVEKFAEVREAIIARGFVAPIRIKFEDSDGKTVFETTLEQRHLDHRCQVADFSVNGYPPVRVTATDANGNVLELG